MRTSVIALSLIGAANAQVYSALHGYTPVSDLSVTAKIDFDQQGLMDAVGEDPVNFDLAKEKYTNGGNAGTQTLQKLSTMMGDKADALSIKMASDSSISVVEAYASYWSANPIAGDTSTICKSGSVVSGCPNYADVMVTAALNNKGDYFLETPGARDVARAQIAKKGTSYHNAWLYSVSELSSAIAMAEKIDTSTKKTTDGTMTVEQSVGAKIDSAWAYWVGSQNGNMPQSLAKSRGKNFGTCSKIPDALTAAFNTAQSYAKTDTFDKAKFIKAATDLVPLMTVPLIQGCLRYANRAEGMMMDLAAGDVANLAILSEAHVFCNAVYPQMVSSDAKTVRDMLAPTSKMTISASTINTALENNYARMSVTKEQIGTWKAEDYDCDSLSSAAASGAASVLVTLSAAVVALFGARRH